MVPGTQEFLGYDDLILVLVGEGLHLGHIHFALNVDGLGFLGKYQRNTKLPCHRIGNGNTGGLNGQHLIDGLVGKAAFEFPADLIQQVNIHLVV